MLPLNFEVPLPNKVQYLKNKNNGIKLTREDYLETFHKIKKKLNILRYISDSYSVLKSTDLYKK